MKIRSLLTATPLAAISASLLAFSPEAHAAQLLYGLDFNTVQDPGSGTIFNNLGSGATSITSPSAFANYNESSPISDRGFSHAANGGTFSIADTSSTGISGLDITTGFSVTFDVRASTSDSNWGDAITFGFGTGSFKVERNGANGWNFYTAGGLTLNGGSGIDAFASSANGDWLNLNFVFKGNQLDIYTAGNHLSSVTIGYTDASPITRLTQIKGGGTQTKGDLYIDNLGVYDGILSSEDFAYISKNGLVASIPEPATATLSLLGLVALLGIRRRQH